MLFLVLLAAAQELPVIENTGVNATYEFLLGEPYAVALVVELAVGKDLNGDGDRKDRVVHRGNTTTGAVDSSGVHGDDGGLFMVGRHVLFETYEWSQGEIDVTLDGDVFDHYTSNYDLATGTVDVFPYNAHLDEDRLTDTYLAAALDESEEKKDLNGDGDYGDHILFVYEIESGATVNTKKAVYSQAVASGVITAVVKEGSASILNWWDPETQELISTGMEMTILHAEQGVWLVKQDGLALYNPTSGILTPLLPGAFISSYELQIAAYHGKVFIVVVETAVDLNGDGDLNDAVLHVVDLATGTVTNTQALAGHLFAESQTVLQLVEEYVAGDLNGDGDTLDRVLTTYDVVTGVAHNTGLAVVYGSIDPHGDTAAFLVSEHDQGGLDLNGDGDGDDDVVHLLSGYPPTLTNLGVHSEQNPSTARDFILFYPSEVEQGVDLNGDGDQADTTVAHIYDLIQKATFNLGLVWGGAVVDENQALLRVPELYQGLDLDGDGVVDGNDATLHIVSVVASCGDFTPYGAGTAGSGGYVPALEAAGCAAAQDELAAIILDGLGGAPAWLMFGLSSIDVPFAGGAMLVGSPIALQAFVLQGEPGAPGAGTATLLYQFKPVPSLTGLQVYAQAALLDPGASSGFVLTQGLRVTFD